MKPTFLLLSILLLAGSGQAQSPRPKPTAQPEVPKSKFVMTAPRPATTSAHSGSRRSGGSHRSRSSFFYPTSPILLTDDTSNSGSADGYGYSPQGAVTTAADFSASGDSSWEPSTYMDYDAALALGNGCKPRRHNRTLALFLLAKLRVTIGQLKQKRMPQQNRKVNFDRVSSVRVVST
jgi:hypothetical protein